MKRNIASPSLTGLALAAATALTGLFTTTAAEGAKPPPPTPSPTYRFVPLGTFGGLSSQAKAVNQKGQVVGAAFLDMNNSRAHAFVVVPDDTNGDGQPDRWFRDIDADGINDLMLDLGLAAGFTGQSSYATDVNDAGQVVVNCSTQDGAPIPRWAFIVSPADVNSDDKHEWFWPDANGANALMIRLEFGPAFAATDCEARSLNRSGQVVGVYNSGRGFLISPLDTDADGVVDTWYQDLDSNGVNDLLTDLAAVEPAAINDAGQVVGSAGSIPFILIPTTDGIGNQLWYADANQDGINDLVLALPPLVTGQQARACALNSAGGVAEWARTSAWWRVTGCKVMAAAPIAVS